MFFFFDNGGKAMKVDLSGANSWGQTGLLCHVCWPTVMTVAGRFAAFPLWALDSRLPMVLVIGPSHASSWGQPRSCKKSLEIRENDIATPWPAALRPFYHHDHACCHMAASSFAVLDCWLPIMPIMPMGLESCGYHHDHGQWRSRCSLAPFT